MSTKPFVAAGHNGIRIPRRCVHPHCTCCLCGVYDQTCPDLDSALMQARNIHYCTRSVLHTAHRDHRSILINGLNEYIGQITRRLVINKAHGMVFESSQTKPWPSYCRKV